MGMRIGQGLLDVVNQATRLLERFHVPPEQVSNVIQDRRYRDTFSDGRNPVDNWLTSKDFDQKYKLTVAGESYRAEEAQRVQKKFEPYFRADTFQPFQAAPVSLDPNKPTIKAATLQRVLIAA
jgi:hypothetical protein